MSPDELRAREDLLMQESRDGVLTTIGGPLPVYTHAWAALRSFLCDLGCHQAERLVLILEERYAESDNQ